MVFLLKEKAHYSEEQDELETSLRFPTMKLSFAAVKRFATMKPLFTVAKEGSNIDTLFSITKHKNK